MKRTAWLALALVVAGLQAGCVTRRVMITSDPPGAIVYRNGQPLGPTPVEESFVYYGRYQYRLVLDGYQPVDVEKNFDVPWYEYPGLDFIFENLVPFSFRDVQQLHVQMVALQPVRPDDVRAAAENLRQRGKTIGPPANAPPPRRPRNPPPPAVVPPAGTLPPPDPVVPPSGVEPAPSAGFRVTPSSGAPSR
jgi:hypothetical protein